MATVYSSRHSKPLGGGDNAFGGAGLNLGIEALAGETEMVTMFDDFNDRSLQAAAAVDIPRPGWDSNVINTATANGTSINDPASTPQPRHFESSLRIVAGTDEDAGVNMQIIGIGGAATQTPSPHMWIQDRDADAAGNDNQSVVFACRIGLGLGGAAAGDTWQGKAFIGWALSGDVQVLAQATGAIDLATAGPLLGFHVAEDGHIDLISVRDGFAGPLVDGTHFTQLVGTGWNDDLIAIGNAGHRPIWFDLALRAEFRDASNAADNGAVQGFARPQLTQAAVANVTPVPGRRPVEQSSAAVANPTDWRPQGVSLQNQLPSDTGLEIVPTIECQNGGAVVGEDVIMWVDWWSFGVSRSSRR